MPTMPTENIFDQLQHSALSHQPSFIAQYAYAPFVETGAACHLPRPLASRGDVVAPLAGNLSDSGGNSFHFSTTYFDPESHPHAYYTRDYIYVSLNRVRFLSRDPMSEIGSRRTFGLFRQARWRTGKNRYEFCGNEPIAFVDRLGEAYGNPVPPIVISPPLEPELEPGDGDPTYEPDIDFICGPFDPPCCSQGECIAWTIEKAQEWITLGSSACLSGCALVCIPAIGTGPGYFACYGVCIVNCEAAVLAGVTAGAVVCSALCFQCDLP